MLNNVRELLILPLQDVCMDEEESGHNPHTRTHYWEWRMGDHDSMTAQGITAVADGAHQSAWAFTYRTARL